MKRYWATVSAEDRQRRTSIGGKAKWANMSKKQQKEHIKKMTNASTKSSKKIRKGL